MKSKIKIPILYEDSELIVVHKPSGLTVYPEAGSEKGQDAQSLLKTRYNGKLFPVHRLDKGTCGVLIFALDSRWGNVLKQSFFRRSVHKTYRALVIGKPPQSGSINSALKSREGKEEPALTRYKTVKHFKVDENLEYSLLEVDPKTGRFHQIRRHLKTIGHPLLGDEKYGNSECNSIVYHRYKVDRPLLSAVEIVFPHPKTRKQIRVKSKPDQDFQRLCEI